MAKIVAAYAVPHTPSFVLEVAESGPTHEAARFFATVKTHLEQVGADVLVLIQNDHFNTFFFDNWPTFAIGVASSAEGPSDQTPEMPRYELAIEQSLATSMLASLVDDGFDFSASHELGLDHSVLVPIHFMAPDARQPIVPIYVNCLVPPLPSARRCYALGRSLKKAINDWQSDARVAVIASGSLSLEVGGPRMEPGKTYGVPDKAWALRVLDLVQTARHEELVEESSPARFAKAGNVAGEILNWIVLLGAIGPVQPDIVINQPALGNAFIAWGLGGGKA